MIITADFMQSLYKELEKRDIYDINLIFKPMRGLRKLLEIAVALGGIEVVMYDSGAGVLSLYDPIDNLLTVYSNTKFILGESSGDSIFGHRVVRIDTLDLTYVNSKNTVDMSEIFRFTHINEIKGRLDTDSLQVSKKMFANAKIPRGIDVYELSKKVSIDDICYYSSIDSILDLNKIHEIEFMSNILLDEGDLIGSNIEFKRKQVVFTTKQTNYIKLNNIKVRHMQSYGTVLGVTKELRLTNSSIEKLELWQSMMYNAIGIIDLSGTSIESLDLDDCLHDCNIEKLILNDFRVGQLKVRESLEYLSIDEIEYNENTDKRVLELIANK